MDFLVGILDSNVNYGSIILIILGYILLLWLMVAFWVAYDAKKRYKNIYFAVGFFVLIIVLNIPALLFYLIIRPEKEEDNILFLNSADEQSMSGVNVPIVNFTGDDGFLISLQLKVGNKIKSEDNSNMNINIDFNSNNTEMKVGNVEKVNVKNENEVQEKVSTSKVTKEKLKNKFNTLKLKAKSTSKNIMSSVKNYSKSIDDEGSDKK